MPMLPPVPEQSPSERFDAGFYRRYYRDPNKRDTLFTRLGVFENFDPKIPDHFRDSPFVFLGNIHPTLQLKVQ